MALNDWYELKLKGSYGAFDNTLMVFHFERLAGLYTALEINQAFIDTIYPLLFSFVSSSHTWDEIETKNLGDPLDFQQLSLGSVPGSVAGDTVASFVAYKLQFLRERTDMKHGWKRIPGVPESLVAGNGVAAAAVTALTTLGTALVAPIEIAAAPGVDVARFGIIARICAEFGPAGACLSYRLPENDAELTFYQPTQFVAHNLVASQVSRKG